MYSQTHIHSHVHMYNQTHIRLQVHIYIYTEPTRYVVGASHQHNSKPSTHHPHLNAQAKLGWFQTPKTEGLLGIPPEIWIHASNWCKTSLQHTQLSISSHDFF